GNGNRKLNPVIREILQLDDAEGVVCLANEEIFASLAQMGYEKPSTKLTFYKAFFSSQWKFLIHTLLQSLSAKRTSWNEFSTAMASAETVAEDVANEAIPSTPTLLILPSPPSHDIPSTSQTVAEDVTHHVENFKHDKDAQKLEIIKLKARVKRLERANKDADTAETEGWHAAEHAEKQAEIYHLYLDHPSKVLSMQEDDSEVQEVVEVVTTAKLITEVVTAATSQVSAASATISAAKLSIHAAAPTVVAAYTRKRKRVIIRDP
nr:hypothetical protein [Tanacetum cinerariifolium]